MVMEIRLPQLGEGADSGSVATIFVKEGDTIQKDDPIIELESEKAIASIPSPAAGQITKIHVKTGDTVKVGQTMISLAETEAAPKAEPRGAPRPAAAEQAEEADREEPTPPERDDRPPAESATKNVAAASPKTPVTAAPSVRKTASLLGIELGNVRASEPGRVSMGDLRAYVQRLQRAATGAKPGPSSPGKEKAAADRADYSKWGEIARKPMTQLRKVIAQRMTDSWTTIPHVTQFDEADITDINELRKKYATAYEEKGGRLTLTPILLRALVDTLKKHPLFNASLDEEAHEIIYKEYYNIGIAVDTEHGLIVPVIHNVDKKSILELSIDLEKLATRTRDRKIAAEDVKGNTFTVSNQGGIGGGHFTPIINKPDVAVLGLGRGAWKAVVRDKKIAPRMMLPLCLSYDHRVADGANAARFVVDLVQAIERFDEKDLTI